MSGMKPLRICHVISGLETGGAESMLYKLLSGLDRERFEAEVVSLTSIGPTGPKIQKLGVPVRALGLARGIANPLGVLRLARWLRGSRPDLVQTWMYHADLLGGLAARLVGVPVVWNIRHSDLSAKGNKRTTILARQAGARLSRMLPQRIICCSEVAQEIHIQMGYAADRMVVIPNGFDLEAFRPDPAARRSVRRELDLPDQAHLIGLVARFNPQKDHATFVEAARRLAAQKPGVHFLLCGDGVTWMNHALTELIRQAGLADYFHLLGPRDDIPRLSAALDLAASSSAYGEGFPNVVGEAMACGVSCVVTHVGDSALIVGNTGRVVAPGDPGGLAKAWAELLSLPAAERQALGAAARERVQALFALPVIVQRYQDLHEEIIRSTRGR